MTETQTETSKNGHGKKGFDAPRGAHYVFSPEELHIAGIDSKADESDPLYDPRVTLPLPEEYVENMIATGVIMPVVIVKRDGRPFVVDGRQRVRGAREANKIIARSGKTEAFLAKYGEREPIRVDAVVIRGDGLKLAETAATANAARFEETLLGKAARSKRVMDLMSTKMTDGEKIVRVARAFAVTETAIRQWLSILDAAPAVRRAVERGDISPTAAVALTKAGDGTHKAQVEALEKLLASGEKPTAANAARAAGKDKPAKAKKKAKKAGDEDTGGDGNPLPKGPGRGKRSVKKALLRIQDNKLRCSSEVKDAVEMAVLYCLGDDLDGEIWSEAQTDKVLRMLTGRME